MEIENYDPIKIIKFCEEIYDNVYVSKDDKNIIKKYHNLINILKKLNNNELKIIFSSNKFLMRSKILIDPILAKNDFHVFRIKLHDIIVKYRINKLKINFNDDIKQFKKNGILILPNFLNNNDFNKLKKEVEVNYEKINLKNYLQGKLNDISDKLCKMNLKETHKFINNDKLNTILYSMIGIEPKYFYSSKSCMIIYELLKENNLNDPQTNPHIDTFQHTYRWWFYLDDVNIENGPFHYVKGSHKNTQKRLNLERDMYNKVINKNKNLVKADYEGSFRLKTNEKLKPIITKKNTLIIVDTHGIHKRGIIKKNHSRFSIFGSSRLNPFYIP